MTADPDLDEQTRKAVVAELDSTLFVEAGAGSGKTSCLVARFLALVESGVPADGIGAITFTEKAAAELVDRVRTELQNRPHNALCRDALLVLDNAAIGTLHSFAQRILTEHPIEAGVPPRFTVTDEIASQVGFDARWDCYLDEFLADANLENSLRRLLASGGKLTHLRDVAIAFNANWDLVEDRLGIPPPPPADVDISDILAGLTDVIRLADHCTSPEDKLLIHMQSTVRDLDAKLRSTTSAEDKVALLNSVKLKCGLGQRDNWAKIGKDAVVERLANLATLCEQRSNQVLDNALQILAYALAQFTTDSAHSRRVAGELEFHDLLVFARSVLRDDEHGLAVRAALAQRYPRLLLDEFQDTDPIQISLAVLIASTDPAAPQKNWWDVPIKAGHLFFVGDPKQSIYRFRRADIETFLKARDQLVGAPRQLTKNFRTGKPIVDWVNATFGKLITEKPGSQPAYLPLTEDRSGPDIGPPVAFFGEVHDPKLPADEVRAAEANDVSRAVLHAVHDRWSVAERGPSDEEDRWRPARWSDIAILLPARTSLPFLERALEAANIPYRAETSSLVYGTREIRDLILVARAIEDPTDSLAVVSALRTPGFGCGDDDLFTWRRCHNGRWDHQRPLPQDAPPDHPVALGLSWLCRQHRDRLWLSPSQLLERILRERRFFELGAVERRPRDLWRRLRFVLDQCRGWEEAGGNTFRDYLRWVEGQSAEGSRVIETVLPESDDDAVRILTVHGAKGLEFPIVILSGLTTAMSKPSRGVEVRFPPSQGWAIKLKSDMSTTDFDEHQPWDEQMDHDERLRLLYVAATRARDHLVVSVHRKPPGKGKPTSAQVLHDAGWDPDTVEMLDVSDELPFDAAVGAGSTPEYPPLPTLEEWNDERERVLAAARRPLAISATRLAAEEAAKREAEEAARRAAAGDPGLAKGPRDIDLPPWQKGRYGTAIGRAVHGVLQTVDLATGEGLAAACAAQAAAEGVLGRENVIESLSRAALDSEIVRVASRRRHWREVYVGMPLGDQVLEGYIDLLYEDGDALVIVDYKTDSWRSESDLDAKVERYRVQLRAYAAAVRGAVGREVLRGVLLFLSASGAAARVVEVCGNATPDDANVEAGVGDDGKSPLDRTVDPFVDVPEGSAPQPCEKDGV